MALTQIKGSILSDEIYRRENNLGDVLDKAVARNNLSVFAKEDFVNFVFMFAGFEADIPDGFQLCNGVGQTSNGVNIPDLRSRFIVGSGSSYSTGSKGGSSSYSTSSTGSHTHTISVNNTTLSINHMPAHNHNFQYNMRAGNSTDGYSWVISGGGSGPNQAITTSGGNASHNHGASCNSTGNHNHSVNVIPPYYALAFIIKL